MLLNVSLVFMRAMSGSGEKVKKTSKVTWLKGVNCRKKPVWPELKINLVVLNT